MLKSSYNQLTNCGVLDREMWADMSRGYRDLLDREMWADMSPGYRDLLDREMWADMSPGYRDLLDRDVGRHVTGVQRST